MAAAAIASQLLYSGPINIALHNIADIAIASSARRDVARERDRGREGEECLFGKRSHARYRYNFLFDY